MPRSRHGIIWKIIFQFDFLTWRERIRLGSCYRASRIFNFFIIRKKKKEIISNHGRWSERKEKGKKWIEIRGIIWKIILTFWPDVNEYVGLGSCYSASRVCGFLISLLFTFVKREKRKKKRNHFQRWFERKEKGGNGSKLADTLTQKQAERRRDADPPSFKRLNRNRNYSNPIYIRDSPLACGDRSCTMQYRCGWCGARDNGSDGRRADVGLGCSPGEVPAGSQVPVSRSSPRQRCAPEPLPAPLFAPLLNEMRN